MSIHRRITKSGTKYDVKLRRPDGTQYQKSFKLKKEAETYEAQQKVGQNNGTWLDDRNTVTFEEMAKRWLASNAAKRQKSRDRDIGILNKHLLPAIGDRSIKTIKHTDITEMVNTWVLAGLAPGTIRRHIAVLSAIFNTAIFEDLIHKSPTKNVVTPRVDPSKGRALTPYEAQTLLTAIDDNYYALVYVMLTTGIRWSEAVGLQIKHFQPMGVPPTLSIEQGAHETGNGHVIEKPKSAASRRIIVLSREHVAVIARHLKNTNRTAIDAEAPLFTSTNGGLLVASNFRSRIWQPATEKAGLKGLTIKDMRKTAATNLLQSGLDTKTVTAVMGHEDIRTTLNHYAKTTPESLLNAAHALVAGVNAPSREASAS